MYFGVIFSMFFQGRFLIDFFMVFGLICDGFLNVFYRFPDGSLNAFSRCSDGLLNDLFDVLMEFSKIFSTVKGNPIDFSDLYCDFFK